MVAKRGTQLLQYNAIRYEEWLPIVYKKMKDNSHLYMFVSGGNICELQTEAEKVGFTYTQIIVNDKRLFNSITYIYAHSRIYFVIV